MSIYGRLIAVFILLFSTSVFADTYFAIGNYRGYTGTFYTSPDSACQDYTSAYGSHFTLSGTTGAYLCKRDSDPVNYSINLNQNGFYYSCPAGGTLSGSNCINATACVSPQIRLSTGFCGLQVCLSPLVNSPVNGKCIPPPGLQGIDCYNGKTVYVPAVCPVNPLDAIRADITPPAPGEFKTCKNGHVVTYPTTCLSEFTWGLVLSSMPGGLPASSFFKNSPTVNAITDLVMTKGANGEYVLATNWINKIQDIVGYSRDSQTIAKGVVADSVEAYRNGVSGNNFLNTIASRSSGELVVTGNQLYPVGSPTALTPNQVLGAMEQYGASLPPSVDLQPYIPLNKVLGIENSIDLAASDFQRIYDKDPLTQPLSLSPLQFGLIPSFQPDPSSDTMPEPLVNPMPVYRPQAINPLPVPAPLPQQPNTFQPLDPVTGLPTPAPQPTATDPYKVQPPGEPPVQVPNLENDKQPYFPWLQTANPFFFLPTDFLPALPVTTCSYVVDFNFHVPFLGTKFLHIAPCDKLAPLRAILAWAFAVLTAITIFFIVFRTTAVF